MQPDELKALRKGANMTLAEMAEAIGMSADGISRMELGKPGYPIEKRTALAAILACRVPLIRFIEDKADDDACRLKVYAAIRDDLEKV